MQIAVAPGAYAASYAFLEVASGRRSAFTDIPVAGVALALERGGVDEKAPAKRKAA